MKKRGLKVALMCVLGIAAVALFGLAVMLLWNWLMPTIFGLIIINYWQALGLLVLGKILFSGFGRHGKWMHHHRHGHHGMHHHNAMREKWAKMTPEQQKEFIRKRREHMKGFHFGGGCDEFFGQETEKTE